jgi:hypothetical protein
VGSTSGHRLGSLQQRPSQRRCPRRHRVLSVSGVGSDSRLQRFYLAALGAPATSNSRRHSFADSNVRARDTPSLTELYIPCYLHMFISFYLSYSLVGLLYLACISGGLQGFWGIGMEFDCSTQMFECFVLPLSSLNELVSRESTQIAHFL